MQRSMPGPTSVAPLAVSRRPAHPRWRVGLSLLMCAVLVSACSPGGENLSAPSHSSQRLHAVADVGMPAAEFVAPQAAAAPMAKRMANAEMAAPAPVRYLAVRHAMQIEAPAADLESLWSAVKARCEQLDCLVEDSSLQRETSHSAGGASLTMRVNPRDFGALTAALGTQAKVLNHQTSSEDKTDEVIDVEAQIKNRNEYRDSLRELLREKNVKRTLSDLMEIRNTLSQAQAEIDAASARRQILERDTAKQFVRMQFQPQQAALSGTYSPWLQTWEQAWRTLTDSGQGLVITVAALLPWLLVASLVLGLPAVWLRRKWRAKHGVAAPATAG